MNGYQKTILAISVTWILALLYLQYDREFRGPRYTVNTCYDHVREASEQWEKDSHDLVKIVAVGKRSYGYQLYLEQYGIYGSGVHSEKFYHFEHYYTTTLNCPPGETR